jgi:hypothetical protein
MLLWMFLLLLLLLLLHVAALTPLLGMGHFRLPLHSRHSSFYVPMFCSIQQSAAVAMTTEAGQHHACLTASGRRLRCEYLELRCAIG